MKQRPARRAGWFWIALVTSAVLACDGSQSAAPAGNEVRSIIELPNLQVLFEGTEPLRAAVYRTDSVFSGLTIGRLTLDGRRGDEVGLLLDIPDYVLAAVGPMAKVRIAANGRSETFGLLELSQGMVVHRLARTGQTRMTVELERRVEGVRDGAVRLLLRTNATIRSADLPWKKAPATEQRKLALLGFASPCTIQIGSGSCGTMTYTVVPSAATTPEPGALDIGGTFQSQPGNGPSTTIRITFSEPIGSITATIHDPTWAGNRMVAFDLNTGQQVSVDFVGNGTPGTTTTDTKTLAGRFTSVDLIPAANDYVSYDAEVVEAPQDTTCKFQDPDRPQHVEPLNDLAVRAAMDSMLARGTPDAPFTQRREKVGVVRKNADGSFRVDELPATSTSQCGLSWSLPVDVSIVALVHTHPFADGDVPGCPGAETVPYKPLVQGGGSGVDWFYKGWSNGNIRAANNHPPIPWYIIDKDFVHYMPANSLQDDKETKSISRSAAGGQNPGGCKWI
jgi:hypothetical protein